MTTRPVPDATVSRLPLYLRVLVELADQGEGTVSSDVLADAARLACYDAAFGRAAADGVGV